MKLEQQPTLLKILLADDDTDDRYFFEEALKGFLQPTELIVVQDGEQLLQLLTNETNELPHVLFLDLNMPRKNGFECLSQIKASKRLKDLPVIIYSTSFHRKIAELLYENGANYYISKPSEMAQLKKAIQQTLTAIAQKNILQPAKKYFIVTAEKKNYSTFLWFNNFFTMPFAYNFN